MENKISYRQVALYFFCLVSTLLFDLKINKQYSEQIACLRHHSTSVSYSQVIQEKVPISNDALSSRSLHFFHVNTSFSTHSTLFPFLSTVFYPYQYSRIESFRYKYFQNQLFQYSAFFKRYILYCKLSF